MCLITEEKETRITDEDIICYKILNHDLTSTTTNYQYVLNKLNETKITMEEMSRGRFMSSDSCWADWKATERYIFEFDNILNVVSEGFHSFLTLERLFIWVMPNKVYKCLIPAGSEIITDDTGLIVSNQIIILEKCVI